MSIHDLTIVKRIKNPRNPARDNPSIYVEADSMATCSCGWKSAWQSTEQLAREEYGKHKFSVNLCVHEWQELDSQFNSERYTDVVCTKCQMSGQLDEQTKEVFFPAT